MIRLAENLDVEDQLISPFSIIDKKEIESIVNKAEYINSAFASFFFKTQGPGTIVIEAKKCDLFRNYGRIEVNLVKDEKNSFLLDEIPFRLKKSGRGMRDELTLKYYFIKKEYLAPLSCFLGVTSKSKKEEAETKKEEEEELDYFEKEFYKIQQFWSRPMKAILYKYFSNRYKKKEERRNDKRFMLDFLEFTKYCFNKLHGEIEEMEECDVKDLDFKLLVDKTYSNMENFINHLCFVKFDKYEPLHLRFPKSPKL